MDLVTILAETAAHESKDSTAFYVIGGLLALFGVIVGLAGIMRPNWEKGPTTAAMVVGAVLAVATVTSSILVT